MWVNEGKCSFLVSPETGDVYYAFKGWEYDGVTGRVYRVLDKYYYVKSIVDSIPDRCNPLQQDSFNYCCSRNNIIYCRNPSMVTPRGGIYYYKLHPIRCQKTAERVYKRMEGMMRELYRSMIG